MKAFYFGLFSICLSVVGVGCGGGPLDENNLKDTRWSTDCSKSAKFKQEIEFSETDMTLSHISYEDSNCSRESSRTRWVYDYTLGKDLGSKAGGISEVKMIDFKLKQYTHANASEAASSYLFKDSYTGLAGKYYNSRGEEQEVMEGLKIHTIIGVDEINEGKTLFLGLKPAFEEDKRSVVLDFDLPFKKR